MAGLLDFLGGGQAQMPGQQPSGLARLFQPEIALPMAAALLGNEGNGKNFANALQAGGQAFAQTAKTNKTLDFFRQNAPEYAQMVDAGLPISDAFKLYTEQRYAQGGATDDIKEYQFALKNGQFDGSFTDWQTKGVRDQDPTFGREMDLRQQYDALPEVKDYKVVRSNFERIRQGVQLGSGAGDAAIVFGYMKMLDPTSVVREGEQATTRNAAGVPEAVRGLYNQIVGGGQLSAEARNQILAAAEKVYGESSTNIEDVNKRYTGFAGAYDLDPSRIVAPVERYEPLQIGGPPKQIAPGVTIRKVR